MSNFNALLMILGRGKYFSSLDVKGRYWNIKLSEKSSYLTTIKTPFGFFKWNRLLFGLVSSGEVFQK